VKNLPLVVAACVSLLPALSQALDVGFESVLLGEYSSNAFLNDSQAGVDGTSTAGKFEFSLFGQQNSELAEGGFLADFNYETVQNETEGSEDIARQNESLARFYGGLSFATPLRSLNWYVGDVLTSLLDENQLQRFTTDSERQINVFVTGPEFKREIGVMKTLDAHLYYAHQSDDTDVEPDRLYNFGTTFTSELDTGRSWGIRLSDIYTQRVSDDYNRFSGAVFLRSEQALMTYDGAIGGTQYDSSGEGTTGLRLELGVSRSMSETRTLRLSATHDLIDQTLGAFEDLVAGSSVREEGKGVSAETGLNFNFESRVADDVFYIDASAINSDFQLVSKAAGFTTRDVSLRDNRSYSIGTGLVRALTPRVSIKGDLGYERLEFVNRAGEIDSYSATIALDFALNNRWSLTLGTRYLEETGLATSIIEGDQGDVVSSPPDVLDSTENRVFFGVRWAPPTRASNDVGGAVRSFR